MCYFLSYHKPKKLGSSDPYIVTFVFPTAYNNSQYHVFVTPWSQGTESINKDLESSATQVVVLSNKTSSRTVHGIYCLTMGY